MVDGDNNDGRKEMLELFFSSERFYFPASYGENIFILMIFQYDFQTIKFLNITEDDDFTSQPI